MGAWRIRCFDNPAGSVVQHSLSHTQASGALKTLRGLVNAFCLRRNANPFKFMACHCFGIKLSECNAREWVRESRSARDGEKEGGTCVTSVVRHAQTCMQIIAAQRPMKVNERFPISPFSPLPTLLQGARVCP